ncbi:HAD-IIIA family hydrolase [Asticcacaulis sp. YBE204]|uniref:HAD-IIIA family hydrolase n=1 Tax=Asticcacaulis sp. YBE204 TaxID=1282363 RepID=UPI000421CCDC|nr:HAD-IIIA family hydrolase [Asticcacaulis sp. YBE204]
MSFSKQLVVLVGGKGTRLGEATKNTPKPLMPITDTDVFLDYFLRAAARQGFDDILMLAGHLGEQVQARYDNRRFGEARISVLIEPEPMGTGGAFRFASERLAPTFVAANGDTLFDTNIRALDHVLQSDNSLLAALALRHVDNAGRYGSVDFDGKRIAQFREKDPTSEAQPGHINGGIYALRRDAILQLDDGPSSIEADLFPRLAAEGRLGGLTSTGYFLDIGLPETLATARKDLPAQKRAALFLDRDGVINIDTNYLHKVEDLVWVDGVTETIRAANDRGLAVIVVTNQAGIARGYYSEGDMIRLHHHLQDTLNSQGAFIDGFYFCPYHEAAEIERYRIANHPDRKPNPGMILKAALDHNIDLSGSLLIGDNLSDVEAATRAGVRGHLFTGGNLMSFVEDQTEILL